MSTAKRLLQQKEQDTKAQDRYLSKNESMYVKNYSPGPMWLPAPLLEPTGLVSYGCKL